MAIECKLRKSASVEAQKQWKKMEVVKQEDQIFLKHKVNSMDTVIVVIILVTRLLTTEPKERSKFDKETRHKHRR